MAVLVLAVFSLRVAPTGGRSAKAPAFRPPRLVGTRLPDLNGVWQAMNNANWDIQAHDAGPSPLPRLLGAYGAMPGGAGIVGGGEIPYQPWALEQRRKNFEDRPKGGVRN